MRLSQILQSELYENPKLTWIILVVIFLIVLKNMLEDGEDDYLINIILTTISGTILFIAPLIHNSNEFFIALRFIVSFGVLNLLVLTIFYPKSKISIALRNLLVLILLIYNVFYPVYLNSQSAWIIIDYLSLIFLILNNIYSYGIAEPFSDERHLIVDNYIENKCFFMMTKSISLEGRSGFGCIISIIVFLVLVIIMTISHINYE